MFKSQALHGICTESTLDDECGENHSARVLIWGGRFLSLLTVENRLNHEGGYQIHTRPIVKQIHANDWIFDACFSQVAAGGPESTSTTRVCNAVLVTAHDALVGLNFQAASENGAEAIPNLQCVAAGPRSILYSAHVVWPQNGRGLVAAGTVFGEVLLWSFSTEQSSFASEKVVPGQLHYTFTGHEGSVFGVQISEEIPASDVGFPRRVLASCSDDRTIRIWDISNLETDAIHSEVQEVSSGQTIEHLSDRIQSEENSCLATVSGHSSRIWGVRFLYQQKNALNLMSYGEDSTAQFWQLGFASSLFGSSKKYDFQALTLHHQYTRALHSGKNIWAVATHLEPDIGLIIFTGGADGRVASYFVKGKEIPRDGDVLSGQWTIREAYMSIGSAADHNKDLLYLPITSERESSSQRILFQGLQGMWLLRRKIKSAISTYPSGAFEGTAKLEARDPTNEAYDLEYLYTESGEFTTEQGYILNATRRYVYRFQENSNIITAWFVCTEDRSTVDYLFHTLDFGWIGRAVEPPSENGITTLSASGYHLCIDDEYQANYDFHMEDATLNQWEVAYVVKGPSKDYVADARYFRDCSLEHSTAITELTTPIDKISQAPNILMESAALKTSLLKSDSFKGYAWVSEDCFITSTEHGNLLAGSLLQGTEYSYGDRNTRDNLPTVTWEKIGHVNELKSSCIITRTQSCAITVFSGSEGTIYMYQRYGHIHPITKVTGKVACLSAQILSPSSNHHPQEKKPMAFTIAIFASCLGSSTAHALIVGYGEQGPSNIPNLSESRRIVEIFQHILVILPPIFIATNAFFIGSQNILVLGSRTGRISIYDLLAGLTGPVACSYISENLHGHGEDAITAIEHLPIASGTWSDNTHILTTGRDGKYSVHQIILERVDQEKPHINLRTVHTCSPPFGPNIEGACFVAKSNDLLLWGFRSKHFVVWNETQKTEVMTIECGGASRNWAYIPQSDGGGGGSFVWTKASICNIQSQAQASHQVLQYGGHGREIKAMAISPPNVVENGHGSGFIATGAEDTAIRIFGYDPGSTTNINGGFKCLGIFTNHKTGLQQLKWSPDGNYLFSAAGLEEFFIWRVRSVPCIGVGMVCEAQFPPVTESCDLRIMNFDIIEVEDENDENGGSLGHQYILTLVYSDSSVRVRYRC